MILVMFQVTICLVSLVIMMGGVIFCCLVMVFSDKFLVRCLYLDLSRFKNQPLPASPSTTSGPKPPGLTHFGLLYPDCTLVMIFSESFPDRVWSADVEVGQPCSVFPVRTFSY